MEWHKILQILTEEQFNFPLKNHLAKHIIVFHERFLFMQILLS